MSLTITNPTYATQGPAKSGQVFAPNALSDLEVAFVGRATITLDGSTTTGTINFIDGTQTVFANGNSSGTTTAPASVTAQVVGGTQTGYIGIMTGTPTTTGFPFTLSGAGTNTNTIVVQFAAYKA